MIHGLWKFPHLCHVCQQRLELQFGHACLHLIFTEVLNPTLYTFNINRATCTTLACKAALYFGLGHCACKEETSKLS